MKTRVVRIYNIHFLPPLLLIVVLYFFYSSIVNDAKHLTEQTLNGTKNPYRIKNFVYRISTFETEEGGKHSPSNTHYCFAEVYSLLNDAPKSNLEHYLNQLNEKKIRQANQKFIASSTNIQTRWIKLSELTPNLFNPSNTQTESQGDQNKKSTPKNQGNYLDFLDCKNFLITQKSKLTAFSLEREEDFKGRLNRNQFNQSTVAAVIQDPESLVKMEANCSYTKVEYYSIKHKVYINTMTALRMVYSRTSKELSHNSVCFVN